MASVPKADEKASQRPWWLRLDGLPPSAERALAGRTREIRWDRFGPMLLAVVLVSVALSVKFGAGYLGGPIGALTGVIAPQTRFFTRPIQS